MEELIVLSESLEISTVASCREEWQERLLEGRPTIRLVVDNLNKVDTAGLQLLLALRKDAVEHGKKFLISGHSEALRSQTDILGLTSILLSEAGDGNSIALGSDLA